MVALRVWECRRVCTNACSKTVGKNHSWAPFNINLLKLMIKHTRSGTKAEKRAQWNVERIRRTKRKQDFQDWNRVSTEKYWLTCKIAIKSESIQQEFLKWMKSRKRRWEMGICRLVNFQLKRSLWKRIVDRSLGTVAVRSNEQVSQWSLALPLSLVIVQIAGLDVATVPNDSGKALSRQRRSAVITFPDTIPLRIVLDAFIPAIPLLNSTVT